VADEHEARRPRVAVGAGAPRLSSSEAVCSGLPVIVHRNLIVIIDHGQASAADYVASKAIALERARAFPAGLGCMVIIPPDARPPKDDARRAIKAALDEVSQHLRCLCWTIEGSGFRAATLRAALAGLGLFVRAPYPTSVQKDVASGLHWLIRHFGDTFPTDLAEVTSSVLHARLGLTSDPANAPTPR